MTVKYRIMVCLTLLLANAVAPAMAEEGLYDPVPPAGSAFVRAISTNASASEKGIIGAISVQTDEAGVTPYAVTLAGPVTIRLGEKDGTITTDEGMFYTVVLGTNPLVVFKDQPSDTPGRTGLSLINLSDAPKSLFITNIPAVIFDNLPPGQQMTRSAKSVTLEGVDIRAGGGSVGSVGKTVLRQRTSLAFIVRGKGTTITVMPTASKTLVK